VSSMLRHRIISITPELQKALNEAKKAPLPKRGYWMLKCPAKRLIAKAYPDGRIVRDGLSNLMGAWVG
jgi:hypothetical protein